MRALRAIRGLFPRLVYLSLVYGDNEDTAGSAGFWFDGKTFRHEIALSTHIDYYNHPMHLFQVMLHETMHWITQIFTLPMYFGSGRSARSYHKKWSPYARKRHPIPLFCWLVDYTDWKMRRARLLVSTFVVIPKGHRPKELYVRKVD